MRHDGGVVSTVALTPGQERALQAIGAALSISDPRLGRRLSAPVAAPASARRELLVMAVLIVWAVLGFAPLLLAVLLGMPALVAVGVVTSVVGTPVAFWATLRWVHRHRFVRFSSSGIRPGR